MSGVVAATAAMHCPAYRTRGYVPFFSVDGSTSVAPSCFFTTKTAFTPGSLSAFFVSTRFTIACGCGDTTRFAAYWKGQGRVIFQGGNAWGAGRGRVVRVEYDAAEDGFADTK